MTRIIVAAALLIAFMATARADIQEGYAAYERGDYATALREFRPLARQGDASAQITLGFMYDKGQGVPQDYAEAVKWYRMAAEQGDADAQSYLGNIFENGQGVPQDYVSAHMWFTLAVAHGDKYAQEDRDMFASKMTPDQIAEAKRLARKWMAKHQQ